jgi:hypothetical protein
MNNNEKPSFDRRKEREYKSNGEYRTKGFIFYDRKEERGEAPVRVELPNIIALYLSISDKSLNKVKSIFKDKLESNIKYRNVFDEESYFEYGIENSNSLVFDLLEEMFVSVVFAYTAVEATVNNLIPNYYSIIKDEKGRKVIDDKEYIEKHYSLINKIKLLHEIYKFELDLNKLEFWSSFTELEEYRNELIHYKSDEIKDAGSLQIGFLTDVILNLLRKDIIESARKLIKFLSQKISLVPGLPYEFSKEPIDEDKLKEFYCEKNILERLNDFKNEHNEK